MRFGRWGRRRPCGKGEQQCRKALATHRTTHCRNTLPQHIAVQYSALGMPCCCIRQQWIGQDLPVRPCAAQPVAASPQRPLEPPLCSARGHAPARSTITVPCSTPPPAVLYRTVPYRTGVSTLCRTGCRYEDEQHPGVCAAMEQTAELFLANSTIDSGPAAPILGLASQAAQQQQGQGQGQGQ